MSVDEIGRGPCPGRSEFTNGECADYLESYLIKAREWDPTCWPRGINKYIERAIWVIRNSGGEAFISEENKSPQRIWLDRGGC